MTKIMCAADLHLGASPEFGAQPGDRLADQERVWQRICELAVEENCDVLAFAGDAWHRRRPSPAELMAFLRPLQWLRNRHDIDVLAIPGNHDREAMDRPTGLDVLAGPLMTVTTRPTVLHAAGVAFACLPWCPPARLVASMNGSVPRDEVNAVAADLLIASARELRAQIAEGVTSILLAHWSVSGSSLPNGLPVDLLREPVLPLPELAALNFDAIVAGHIHQPQVMSYEPPIFYTGSPAVVDFGESRSKHGVWILDTENLPYAFHGDAEWHPIADRSFLTVDVDLTSENHLALGLDETDSLAAGIATHFPIEDAVLRIRYRATPEQARRVDVGSLKKLCLEAGASKVYSVQAEVVRGDRARVDGVDEQMGHLDALDAWVGANFAEIPGQRAEALVDLTSRLLEEVAA